MSFVNTSTLYNEYTTINDRSLFNYEITKMAIEDDYLHIEGWGLVNRNQNLKDISTHKFTVFLESASDHKYYNTELINHDLSEIMIDRRYSSCKPNETNNSRCNYSYKNVGFKTSINLTSLKEGHSYHLYIGIHTKQTNLKLRSPLFYFEEKSLQKKYNDREIHINSNFNLSQFSVYHDALVATPKPNISSPSNQINLGTNCSLGYNNRAYHEPNTLYQNILGKEMYLGLVSYYKVLVKDLGCNNLRRRVGEGSHQSSQFIYVPGTFVTFLGKPLSIDVISIAAPIISANDVEIDQYTLFNPYSYAKAYDVIDKDISNKINVYINNVNTKIPGIYDACYSVKNSKNRSSNLCIRVKVNKINTRIRYINKQSITDAHLSLWKESQLYNFLYTALSK